LVLYDVAESFHHLRQALVVAVIYHHHYLGYRWFSCWRRRRRGCWGWWRRIFPGLSRGTTDRVPTAAASIKIKPHPEGLTGRESLSGARPFSSHPKRILKATKNRANQNSFYFIDGNRVYNNINTPT
jgi:hypothetical protein